MFPALSVAVTSMVVEVPAAMLLLVIIVRVPVVGSKVDEAIAPLTVASLTPLPGSET